MKIAEKLISIFRPEVLAIGHGRRYKIVWKISRLYIISIERYRSHNFACTALFDFLTKVFYFNIQSSNFEQDTGMTIYERARSFSSVCLAPSEIFVLQNLKNNVIFMTWISLSEGPWYGNVRLPSRTYIVIAGSRSYVGGRELRLKFEVEILDKLRVQCRTTKNWLCETTTVGKCSFFSFSIACRPKHL